MLGDLCNIWLPPMVSSLKNCEVCANMKPARTRNEATKLKLFQKISLLCTPPVVLTHWDQGERVNIS